MIDNMEVMTNNYCRLFYRLTSVWSLKSAVHGEAHARAEGLKNKLYGSTLNAN